MSPWSFLFNGTSLMHRCLEMPIGGGVHFGNEPLDESVASVAEIRRAVDARARGVQSTFMLHAAEDLIVEFLSWGQPNMLFGLEAALMEYVATHVVGAPATKYVDLTNTSLLELFELLTAAPDPSSWDPFNSAERGLCATAACMQSPLSAIVLESPAKKGAIAAIISELPAVVLESILAQIIPHVFHALPHEQIATRILHVVRSSSRVIRTVLPAALEALSEDLAPLVVTAVLKALPAESLPDIAPSLLRAVPAKLIASVLPAALQALPTDIVPIVISAALRGSPKSPAVTSSAPSVRKTELAWASSVIVSAAHHCHKPGLRPLNEVNWASSVIGAVLETLPDLPDLPEIIPHILAALPVERLPDLAPAVMRAVPAEQIATVLPGALQVLPPKIATAVVKAVLLKLPEARLPELAPAVLRSVPKQLIPAVLPHALQALPIDLIPRIVSATLRPSSVTSADPPNVFQWARFASVAVAAKLVTELSVGGAVPTETGGSAYIPSARIVELQSLSHSREVALHESIVMIATMGEKIVEMTGRMQEHIAEVIKESDNLRAARISFEVLREKEMHEMMAEMENENSSLRATRISLETELRARTCEADELSRLLQTRS